MSPAAWAAAAVGAGAVVYGLTPLSGSSPSHGVSGRGFAAALAGIVVLSAIGILRAIGGAS